MAAPRSCVSSPRALPGGRAWRELVFGFADRAPGGAIDQNRLDGCTSLGMDEKHAGAFGRKVLVSPGQQRDQDGRKIASRCRSAHIHSAAAVRCSGGAPEDLRRPER